MPASVLEVLIVGDSSQLTAALGKASASTAAFGQSVTKSSATIKSSLGTLVPVSAVAAGVAIAAFAKRSFDAATQYNAAFTKIDAITNASADQIQVLKDRAMELSGETAQSPVELANAIYYLASAGLNAQQQMESLEAVAKGTAIGLGTEGDLAKITAQALNVFGSSGLRAADVMDVLTAAVREGTAEPNEFADALGRVLPIAYKAGLSFSQVAASLATMSNAGLKVNIGTTALRGLLQALVAPTIQSQKALAQMGLTVDDVVQSMAQQGLIATLRMLDTAAKKNTNSTGQYNIMLRNVIPNIRALTGAFNLTTQEAERVDAIFKAVANSGGDMAEAFAVTAQSPAFKLQQAMNDIGIAGQNLATSVLPAVASALGFVGDHAAGIAQALLFLVGIKIATFFINVAESARVAAQAQQVAAAAAEEEALALETEAAAAAGAAEADTFLMGRKVEKVIATEAATEATVEETAATKGLISMEGLAAIAAKALSSPLVAVAAVLYGTVKAVQAAAGEFKALFLTRNAAGGFAVDWNSALNSINDGLRTFGLSVANIQMPSASDMQTAQLGVDTLTASFLAAGITVDQQGPIIQKALADIGGSLDVSDPKQMEAFVQAVQLGIAGVTAQTAAQEHAAEVAHQFAVDQNNLTRANEAWQQSTAKAADSIDGLNTLVGDGNSFLIDLRTTLMDSTNPAQDFAKAIADLGAKWRDFQSAAATSLNFAPQALTDLTSAATQAQSSLADALASPPGADATKQDIADYNANLADLRSQANLTGQDILTAFKQAAAQTKSFGHDLMEISRVGGQAGKDLANSLLQSGDVLGAQVIADSPGKLQKQIVEMSGKASTAADTMATKLTNSIVGPLKNIAKALRVIVEKTWGIDITADDHGSQKKVDKLTHTTNDLVTNPHTLTIIGNTKAAQNSLDTLQTDVEHLVGREYRVNVGVHTHGDSPMPDEALKLHLFDPMRRAGFKRVGDAYTLPLTVGAHTDVGGLGGETAGGGSAMRHLGALLSVEKDSRGYLKEISKSVKGGDGVGVHGALHGGGGTGGGGSSGGGGGGSSVSLTDRLTAAVDKIVGTINKFATPKEARGVVERVAGKGLDTTFIRKSIQQVSAELGKTAAKRYGDALRALDQATRDSEKRRNAALEESLAAIEAIRQAHQAKMEARRTKQALGFEMKNVPTLPRGHTNIDVNRHALGGPGHHPKALTIVLDRRHYADQLSQEVSYGRGY